MPDRPTPPERRMQLTLDMYADDRDSLATALRRLADKVEIDQIGPGEGASGGWSDGYSYRITEDPDMTGDRFRAELEEWRQENIRRRSEDF